MNMLGLAASNPIRCLRRPVARPCGASLRPRGLVVETKVCQACGRTYGPRVGRISVFLRSKYCSAVCQHKVHSTRWANQTPEDRFWANVDQSGDCWLWMGARTRGYGRFEVDGKGMAVHRFAYELLIGPVPEGLQIDHLCRNRPCVNPAHLEPVTNRENTMRGQTIPAARHAARLQRLALLEEQP
jgi:hypothetical protein